MTQAERQKTDADAARSAAVAIGRASEQWLDRPIDADLLAMLGHLREELRPRIGVHFVLEKGVLKVVFGLPPWLSEPSHLVILRPLADGRYELTPLTGRSATLPLAEVHDFLSKAASAAINDPRPRWNAPLWYLSVGRVLGSVAAVVAYALQLAVLHDHYGHAAMLTGTVLGLFPAGIAYVVVGEAWPLALPLAALAAGLLKP